jgi:hypothetical protein
MKMKEINQKDQQRSRFKRRLPENFLKKKKRKRTKEEVK